jgi:ATP-binding cassette subfamily F protein 1
MYEQKRREVNKAFDKFEKQLKVAKSSGKNAKANADKVWELLETLSNNERLRI